MPSRDANGRLNGCPPGGYDPGAGPWGNDVEATEEAEVEAGAEEVEEGAEEEGAVPWSWLLLVVVAEAEVEGAEVGSST